MKDRQKSLDPCLRILAAVVLLIALMTAPVCASGEMLYDFSDETETSADAGSASTSSMTPEQILESMTLKQKVEQMIMPSLRNENVEGAGLTQLTSAAENAIRTHSFCGYYFDSENCESAEQVTRLTASMQRTAVSDKSSLPIPLLLMVDQEGGENDQLEGTLTPGNLALGASGDAGTAEETAKLIGTEMQCVGFNVNGAPFLDLLNNPENPVSSLRSFGSDAKDAAELGAAFIRGLQQTGIATAAKYFPGTGDTSEDSDTGLEMCRKTIEELEESDLIPFRRAVEEGTDLMIAALTQYPMIEKDTYHSISTEEKIHLPASMSDDILTGILRQKLGYDGVIMTDLMDTDAITDHFDPVDAAELAINAGADVILSPGDIATEADIEKLDSYVKEIVERVQRGSIAESSVDASVLRILKLKEERGILGQTDTWRQMSDVNVEKRVAEEEKNVADKESRTLVKTLTEKTTTLLKNKEKTLPLSNENTIILCPDSSCIECVRDTLTKLEKKGILKDSEKVRVYSYEGVRSSHAVWNVSEDDQVVAISRCDSIEHLGTTTADEFLLDAMEAVHSQNGTFTLISSGLPYDTAVYQDADAILASYGDLAEDGTNVYQQNGTRVYRPNIPAAISAVFGGFVPSGSLPVSIPKLNKSGKMTKKILYQNGFGIQKWQTEKVNGEVRKVSAADEDSGSEENSGGMQAGTVIRVLREFSLQGLLIEGMIFRMLLL